MDANGDQLAVVHVGGTVTRCSILTGEMQELDWTGVVDVAFGTGIGPIGLVALSTRPRQSGPSLHCFHGWQSPLQYHRFSSR